MNLWTIIKDTIKGIVKFFEDLIIWLVKNPYGILIVIAVGVFLFVALPEMIEEREYQERLENCTHIQHMYLATTHIDEEKGGLVGECNFCGKTVTITPEVTYPAGENYEPTCSRPGRHTERWYFKTFYEYEYFYTYEIPMLPHNLTEIYEEGYPPTCEEDGATESGFCSSCNRMITGERIEALGHEYYSEGYVAPTCTEEGKTGVEICERCGDSHGEDTTIPTLDHIGVSGTFEATFNVCGFTGKACKDCGYPIEVDEYLSEPLVSEYLEYETIKTGYFYAGELLYRYHVEITSIKTNLEEFVIPDTINGNPVEVLCADLFSGDTTLKSIKFPKHLVRINERAFYNCTGLTEINLPDTIEYIGSSAFEGCRNVRHINIGKGVEGIGDRAFANCYKLITFTANYYTSDNIVDVFESDIFSSVPVVYVDRRGFNEYRWSGCFDHVHLLNDETEHLIYEDGYYFYINTDGEKELIACEDEVVKNNTVIIPSDVSILGRSFFLKTGGVESIVMDRTLYWIKDQELNRSLDGLPNHINIFYYGSEDEAYFTNLGNYGSINVDLNWYYYEDETGLPSWYFNSNNIPTIKE